MLTAGDDEEQLGRIGHHALHPLMRVLGGLAWLAGRREAERPFEQLASIEKLLHRDLPGVRRTMDTSETAHRSKFKLLYADIQALGETADRWP